MQKIRSQEDSSSQLKNADDQIIQYVFISFDRVETLKITEVLTYHHVIRHFGHLPSLASIEARASLPNLCDLDDGISVGPDTKLRAVRPEVWDMQKERRAKNCFEDLTSQLQEEVKLAPCHERDKILLMHPVLNVFRQKNL